jgi:type IV pilus assembly protein PilV
MGRKKVRKKISGRSGFTLIEVMIAILILTVGMLAMALLQVTAIRGGSFANQMTQASIFGQDKIEELKNKSYTDTDLSTGNHSDTVTSGNRVTYTRSWTVTENNPPNTTGSVSSKMKTINLTISWTGPQGQTHNVMFSTIVHE